MALCGELSSVFAVSCVATHFPEAAMIQFSRLMPSESPSHDLQEWLLWENFIGTYRHGHL